MKEMSDNTYLGFDFGTTNVAVGYIPEDDFEGIGELQYFLSFDPAMKPYYIHERIEEFLTSETGLFEDEAVWSPHYAFIESVFKGPNQRTFQRMTRVAHSLDVILSNLGIYTHYLDNHVWRKVLFGKGNYNKEAAQEWAFERWPDLLDLKKAQQGHCADAMMIAEAGRLLVENGTIEKESFRSEGSP
jgi:Holliday junction resolvasome RuvABC endonuclease subunit